MSEIRAATVTETRPLSAHVKEIALSLVGEPLDFAPGQWLSLRLPVGDRPPLNRAYTLANAPSSDGALTLCFDRVEEGFGTGYLWEVAPGTVIEFTGPHGNFTLPMEGDTPLLFVARYTGIVPFRAMLQQLERDGNQRQVHLLYSAPEEQEFVYRDELVELAAQVDWLNLLLVGDGGEITTLEERAAEWMPFMPYICGIREFTKPIRDYLMERFGFERRAVKLEHFS
jgi:ferredoxin-NADP reductase